MRWTLGLSITCNIAGEKTVQLAMPRNPHDALTEQASNTLVARSDHSEREAAATLARECTDHAAVILWCADRVRSVDDSEPVQDAADYLHDLSTRAQVDTDPVTDRPAVIRWCGQQIHSMGGDADVERAAEYLDDLATEALWVQHDEAVSVRQEGEQRRCGYTEQHPSHTFMRLEVLFQCPGEHAAGDEL